MGLRVKTNVSSLIAQRQLAINNEEIQDSLEKLSSGYRINKSSDDVAGSAISETMRAKIKSFGQAKRNASDGVSYLQIADDSLNQMNNAIIRMRELTTQAASDAISQTDREYLNLEFHELGKEVERIKDQTEFNNVSILKENHKNNIKIQVGINFNDEDDKGYNFIDLKYETISDLEESISNLSDLNIKGKRADEIGDDGPDAIFSSIDDSLKQINDVRAYFGSLQNRVNSTINYIDIANENLNASQSRIRDLDYASETAQFAQNRILASAGTSILSQANQLPENVLLLLRQ